MFINGMSRLYFLRKLRSFNVNADDSSLLLLMLSFLLQSAGVKASEETRTDQEGSSGLLIRI